MKNRNLFIPIVFLTFSPGLIFGQIIHPDYQLEIFIQGLSAPLGLENANDGSDRIFIVEKGGRIKIIENGNVLATPFLNISTLISTGGEQGLLGLAFHPDYSVNGYFYVHYTDLDGDSQISRFIRSADPNVANAASEFSVLTVTQPFGNHNAGALRFGPDGYLYIAMGDGGDGGDPGNRAQTRTELLGKMLRIDIDVEPPSSDPYVIPPDNPFVGDATTLDEIWALGLRNPWRFSFDRLTGDMWIGDVGQNAREEVNFQPASSTGGENYGWRCYEGDIAYNTTGCDMSGSYTVPVMVVKHGSGSNSLAGGFVYRGVNECLQGVYFCAETLADTIYTIIPDGTTWSVGKRLISGITDIVSFGEDEAGELYAVSLGGTVYQVKGETTMVNQNPIPPGVHTSMGTILSAGSVQSGTVEFIAPECVELNQPFEVLPGAIFFVTLGCP